MHPQHDHHGRLRHNQLHHRRRDPVRRQQRQHVNCRRHHHHRLRQLARRRLRHGRLPHLRAVSCPPPCQQPPPQKLTSIDRWAWLPQTIVLFILIGVSAKHYDTTTLSTGDWPTITANRLSFFSLSLSVPVSWAGAGSDFYVYYPPTTSKRITFLMTLIGLTLSFCLVNMIGIGLATGVAPDGDWSTAYKISSGALILAGYGSLGGFGKFCGVVVALGVISNNVPGTYAAALGCQVLGRYGKAVPRYIWVCFIVAIYFVCAIAGRNNLFAIFQNFLALMGYWIMIFVTIVLEEHVLYKNALFGGRALGFDWAAWEQPKKLPVGIAALIAFLIGWAGAIIGMYQVWYVGPVATLVGGTGGDIGVWLGIAFTGAVYPGLRWLEIRRFGR